MAQAFHSPQTEPNLTRNAGHTQIENRNPKQIRNSKKKKLPLSGAWSWEVLDFDIRICFGFRNSDFEFSIIIDVAAEFLRQEHLGPLGDDAVRADDAAGFDVEE